jgi:uncharacterized protein (TIGR00725 family)
VNPTLSRYTVGVMGSGVDAHEALAIDVGTLLAELEVNLLTGGGGGVMRAVSRAFVQSRRGRGVCIGILPSRELDSSLPPDGYPNEFVELAIRTHLPYSGERGQDPLSRNHINVLSCAAVVALPGGSGTLSEVSLALRYGKPVIVYAPQSDLSASFPQAVDRATSVDEVRRFVTGRLT